MPKVNLCFSGWLIGVNINQASVAYLDDGDIDVSEMSVNDLVDSLNKKELFIDFVAALRDCKDQSVDLFDFEPTVD